MRSFVAAQIVSPDRKLCDLRVSGIMVSSQNAQAFCKDNLSHTEGLHLVRGHVQGCYRRLRCSSQPGSWHGAHLEVKAGKADCVILLLFAFSLLKHHKAKIWLRPHTDRNVCVEMWETTVSVIHLEHQSAIFMTLFWNRWQIQRNKHENSIENCLFCLCDSQDWSPTECQGWEMWMSCLSAVEVWKK